MSERRGRRLVLEVAFLAGLAAALAFADLASSEIAGAMLVGWLLVGLFEWGTLRKRSHFRGGLPPRWYVPPQQLPPPRPLEQFQAGYPAAEVTSEEFTWISPASAHADWPVPEPEQEHVPLEEEHTYVEEAVVAVAAEVAVDISPGLDAEPEPEPLDEAGDEPEPEVEDGRDPAAPRRPPEPGAVGPQRRSRHRIDPLAEPERKARRFRRREPGEAGSIDVGRTPARPRPLPESAGGRR